MEYVIGIDIGGTCTDCVVLDTRGDVTLAKAFSTPDDFSAGIIDALQVASRTLDRRLAEVLADTRLLIHSTTVVENAVLAGELAKGGLITTRGFEDTLFITRGGYGRWSGLSEDEKRNPIETDKLTPLIPSSLIKGIRERTDARGIVLQEPSEADVMSVLEGLLALGIQAVGVCLLWSVRNPANEQMVGALIRRLRPDLFVTLSHDIAPVVGEYERTSTVALNIGLGPVVSAYMDALESRLDRLGFRGVLLVMQSYGGVVPVAKARNSPVGLIESGPVAGLVGSKYLGELQGVQNVIAADMGGTTFKVGVVREGLIEYQRESMALRHHYSLPKMDVTSLGLAGGSIIAVDPITGAPRVGPRSAGSYPGPICYDHGGEEPTVTDVDATLGYLNPDFFLGGRASLNVEKAAKVFEEKIAHPLGLSLEEAAAAIFRLTNSMICDLLHKVTVQRGLDPRQFALFSFGGTAGMHATAYAEALEVLVTIIPHSASVHGAFGLVASDVVHELQTPKHLRTPADPAEVEAIFEDLIGTVTAHLLGEGFGQAEIVLGRSIDMRYRRQVHILTVPIDGESVTAETLDRTVAWFERLYQEKYGPESVYRGADVDFVNFRVRGRGLLKRPGLRAAEVGSTDPSWALVDVRPAWVEQARAMQLVSGYDFERLVPGNEVAGPAIIWSPITTVVLNPGQTARVDEYRNLVIPTVGR